jgi:predicted nuclease with TOPRIM domain
MFRNGKTVEEVFGVKEEDLKAKLEEGKAAGEKVTKLETELATANTTLSSVQATVNAMKDKLAALENPPHVEERKTTPTLTSFDDDPEKAVTERVNQTVLPLQISNMEMQASLAYDRVRARHSDWDLVQDKVDDLLKNTHLSARVYEATVENAYLIAWAKKSKEKLAAGETLVETGANSGNNGHGAAKKNPVDDLTDEDKKMAASYGMTLEEWAKAKSELRVI